MLLDTLEDPVVWLSSGNDISSDFAYQSLVMYDNSADIMNIISSVNILRADAFNLISVTIGVTEVTSYGVSSDTCS